MKITVDADLANIQTDFPVLPTGWYKAQIKTKPVTKEKKGGKGPYLCWTYTVLDEGVERLFFDNTPLMTAYGLLAAVLEAAEVPYEMVNKKTTFDDDDVLGRFLMIKLGPHSYEGKDSNEVMAKKRVE